MSVQLIDTRGLSKPPRFSGKDEEWRDWVFQFESYIGLLSSDLYSKMEEIATTNGRLSAIDEYNDELKAQARQLYFLLVQLCQGRALTLLRTVNDAHGFVAWRMLKRQYEPSTAVRTVGFLQRLLTPSLRTNSVEEFETDLVTWERDVHVYQRESGETLPEGIKVAVLLARLPPAISPTVQIHADSFMNDYKKLRDILQSYIEATRRWPGTSKSAQTNDEPVPMDVDQLKGKGKYG
eukprot:1562010-Amphidinium_carterae.1